MLRDNRFRLVTLGRLTLVGGGGEEDASLARRRFKLAVLAVLALSRRPIPRDTLLGLFWAETDEARARHSLSNALSSLRRALGERAITTRDADVALDPETPLDVDALEFSEALEGRDPGRAIELYAGPFLEGFHVDESPAFEQWVSRERRRLEAMFLKACSEHCATLARSRRWQECETVASRWLDTEPLSGDAAIYFLNAIKSPGTRPALAKALEEFENLRTRLNKEFELAPHPSVMQLSERIREQLAAAPPEPVVNVRVTAETKAAAAPPKSDQVPDEPAAAPAPPIPPSPEPAAPAPSAIQPSGIEASLPPHVVTTTFSRKRVIALAGAAAVIALAFFTKAKLSPTNNAAGADRPIVAVLSFPIRSTDTATSWLSDGLAQMIGGKLAGVTAIEVASPSQVRAVERRSGRTWDAAIPEAEARDLARRVGATLVAHGSLARDGQAWVLDLSIHEIRSGALVRNAVLKDVDPLSLADQAAVRILGAANISLGGPRRDVETTSLEAYQHYMRALENGRAGRMVAQQREIEASIALDSGFIPALRARIGTAVGANDTALVRRLRQVLARHASRATEFDRMEQEVWDATYAGETKRSEALARGLVRRFPRDPRAYEVLQGLLSGHGEFAEAERVAIAALALDSLAMRAGTGPCDQCSGFFNIIGFNWIRGDYEGAARWSRRWISELPDAPYAWSAMAWTFAYSQRPDSALPLMERAVTLSGNELWAMEQYARMLLVARRYASADSVIDRMQVLHREGSLSQVADMRGLLAREYGRIHDAIRVMDDLYAKSREAGWFINLIRADNRRLLGDYAGASRGYEALTHGGETGPQPFPADPTSARAYCWHHALSADALGPNADTLHLKGIADTLELGCRRSYYGRDWLLQHHVRGLVAMRGGRFEEAEREFEQAIFTNVEGWSRIPVELSKARLAQGKAREAIAALRPAYATRLDAMGRYVPISELDFWMANAFNAAGEADSARVYRERVERAWKNADPEFRAQVATSLAVTTRR